MVMVPKPSMGMQMGTQYQAMAGGAALVQVIQVPMQVLMQSPMQAPMQASMRPMQTIQATNAHTV